MMQSMARTFTMSRHSDRDWPPLRTSQCSSLGGTAACSGSSLPEDTERARCSPAMSRSNEDACFSGGMKPAVYHSGTSTWQ